MYVKSTRPSAKREVQKERSAKRDVQKFRNAQRDYRTLRSAKRDDRALRSAKRNDQIARLRRAQTCERSELRAMRMCPQSGQIFFFLKIEIQFTEGSIGLKEHILIMTLAFHARFSVYISVTFK